jgi:hypothetical protein
MTVLNSCHGGINGSMSLEIMLKNNYASVAQMSDTYCCNDVSSNRCDLGNLMYWTYLATELFVILYKICWWCFHLTLPAMLFHTYRPNTPAIGSTGLVVVLMTANTAVSTPARSATARNNKQLTQIPAFMNFLSGESATSQWCQIYMDGTVVPHVHGQYGGATHLCCLSALQHLGTHSLLSQWLGPAAPPDVRCPLSGRTWGTHSLTRGKTLQQMSHV